MPKKATLQEFIDKSNKVHDYLYDYSKSVYTGSDTKLIIICKNHGEFEQRPHDHINDRNGCPKCGIVKTALTKTSNTNEFIKKSIVLYGEKYEYLKTTYKSCFKPVLITCRIHGDFYKAPSQFLSGHECPKCIKVKYNENMSTSYEIFLQRCKKKHGDRFDYNQSSYTKISASVEIYCKEHSIHFTQNAQTHIGGKGGCPSCKARATSNTFLKTTEKFVEDSILAHGGLYDYSLVEYKNSKIKVPIICKIHGIFQQIPNDHIKGHGCPRCNFEIAKGNYNKTLAYRNKEQYKLENCDLYLLEFNNDNEKFIKIGISKELDIRHSVLQRQSQCKVINLCTVSTNLYEAILIEKNLMDTHKNAKYRPSKKFPGHTECFSITILEDILKVFAELRA